MISARPTTPDSREPAGDRLRDHDQIRLDAEVLHREHAARAAEPGLHLVRDKNDPVLVADARSPSTKAAEPGRSRPRRAAARRRSRRRSRARRESRTSARARREPSARRAPVRVRVRRAVDLRSERPEPRLVRVRLRRHRQRKQRPAVERPLERDHRLPPGVQARELDRVLDRLGARVEERRARLARDRHERAEPLGELDVQLVRDDREVGVEKALRLLLDRLDDPRMAVADVRDPDAADEVDEACCRRRR